MRIPEHAPTLEELSTELLGRFPHILDSATDIAELEHYRHWDDLRHRDPPRDLSRREWWAALKLQRAGAAQPLPLLDNAGRRLTYVRTAHADRLLHRLDMGLAGGIQIPGRGDLRQSGDRYLRTSLMEEAITSSQLEGASTTRRVARDMLRQGREPRDLDERMIWNNYQAIQYVADGLERPLDREAVLEIHRLVTEGTLDDPSFAGRMRETDDIRVVDHRSGRALHTPPPAGELDERLERLLRFIRSEGEETRFIHPVIRAIAAHYQLAYDHPFVDGNGRVARILFYACMLRYGYWLAKYLSVSRIIKRGPIKYAKAYLLTQTDSSDLTYFARYHLDTLRRAEEELQAWVRHTQARQQDARLLVRAVDANPRQVALLDHAVRHPGSSYDIATHQTYHHVSYATARSDLLDLANRGYLIQRKSGRKLVFFASDELPDRLGR